MAPALSSGELERITSGIHGLDEIISGGFLKGSINLISGTTGTGKSIFCSHFLWQGLKQNENCLYMTFEETSDSLISAAKIFGMDFKPYVESKKCIFLDLLPTTFDELEKIIFQQILDNDIKRVVMDSLSFLLMMLKGFSESADANEANTIPASRMRRLLFSFGKKIHDLGVTVLLTSEIPTTQPSALSRFGVEEFVAESITVLRMFEYAGGITPRSLQVVKMRKTKHSHEVHPFVIEQSGIKVLKSEKGLIL
jgi:circadian clock protein KaiC